MRKFAFVLLSEQSVLNIHMVVFLFSVQTMHTFVVFFLHTHIKTNVKLMIICQNAFFQKCNQIMQVLSHILCKQTYF